MRRRTFLTYTFIVTLGWGCVVTPAQGLEPRKDRTVILVSVDGLAHFYLDDPRADVPTLRRLAKEGARAEGMVTVFPSVTWPAHATLSTGVWPGKHGVVANDIVDRATRQKITLLCDPVYDKDQALRVPTVYDVAYQAGLVTAGVLWPITRNAKTLHYNAPDMPGDDAWWQFGTPEWIGELEKLGLPVRSHGRWCRESGGGVPRDWLYTRMARQLLLEHQPNLVMIHLVEPDHVQHRTGPRSDDAYWCASYADDRIRDLVEAVAASDRAQSTYLIVCSDHGFFPYKKMLQPNVVLRQLNLLETKDGKVLPGKAWCVSQGGAAAVYVFDEVNRESIVRELVSKFRGMEGVQAVIGPEDLKSVGQAAPTEEPRCPDLWLAAESGYAFSETATGDNWVIERPTLGGTHGYLPDQPDMLGLCVIWGPGIAPGTNLGKVQIVDIAPTIAAILGLELPGVDGKPLVRP